jgi:hypothetical protein
MVRLPLVPSALHISTALTTTIKEILEKDVDFKRLTALEVARNAIAGSQLIPGD